MRKFILPAVAALALSLTAGASYAATESGVITHVGPSTITLGAGKVRTFEVMQANGNQGLCYQDKINGDLVSMANDGCGSIASMNDGYHVGEHVTVDYRGGRGGAVARQVTPIVD